MPISELKFVVGKNPDPCGYTSVDYAILTMQKSRAKIIRTFKHTPFAFNIYVVDDRNVQPDTNVINYLEKKLGTEIIVDGRTTVVYTSNRSNDYVPMNAWILAHRMAHAITEKQLTPLQKIITDDMGEIYANIYKPIQRLWDCELYKLANKMFSMKSARDNRITNNYDMYAEILAQYIITGSVRYNRLENFNHSNLNHSETTQINQSIEVAEKNSNMQCHNVFQSLVGQVIRF